MNRRWYLAVLAVCATACAALLFPRLATAQAVEPTVCDNDPTAITKADDSRAPAFCGQKREVKIANEGSQPTERTKDIYQYIGIKYANAARWENPVLNAQWSAQVVRFDKAGAACPQGPNPGISPKLPQAEDCLFLNVWTPADAINAKRSLPVMVFIHGGAFIFGTASPYEGSPYDGAATAAHDVVVVTLNYRLGALGFLASSIYGKPDDRGIDQGLPGNFGLRDQQDALLWVQEYIARFGGDPKRVTLYGESAGAMSVGLHTFVVPTSKKLFAAAIMESNPLGLTFLNKASAAGKGDTFLRDLCNIYAKKPTQPGDAPCFKDGAWLRSPELTLAMINEAQGIEAKAEDQESPQEAQILKTVTEERLGKLTKGRQPKLRAGAPGQANSPDDAWIEKKIKERFQAIFADIFGTIARSHVTLEWQPVIDGGFVEGQPRLGYSEGMPVKPIAFGVNLDEGPLFAAGAYAGKGKIVLKYKNGLRTAVLVLFSSRAKKIWRTKRYVFSRQKRYPDQDGSVLYGAENGVAESAGTMLGDAVFTCGNILLAQHAWSRAEDLDQHASAPIYAYRFEQPPYFDAYNPDQAEGKGPDGGACEPHDGKGYVCHANELPYVFNMLNVDTRTAKRFEPKNDDIELGRKMNAAWAAFATNPLSPGPDWTLYRPPGTADRHHTGIPEGRARLWGSGGKSTDALVHDTACAKIWLHSWLYETSP